MKNTGNTNQITDKLNKTHLAVTVLEKGTGLAITKMPIYAEVSTQYIQLPYQIQFLRNPQLLQSVTEKWGDLFIEVNDLVNTLVAKYFPIGKIVTTIPDNGQFENLTNLGKALLEKENDSIFFLLTDNPTLIAEYQEDKNILTEKLISFIVDFYKKNQRENELDEFKDNSILQQYSYPLGFLATDHVGYVSYSISTVLQTINSISHTGELKIDYLIYPLGLDANKISLSKLSLNNRITQDVVFAKLEIEKPDFENDCTSLGLPSMQNPSLADWYISAGSFASQPNFLLGEDCCETLLPSNLSLHQFNFYQVVRANKEDNKKFIGSFFPHSPLVNSVLQQVDSALLYLDYHLGYIDEYKTTWYALGHSLGQILYSLPLAPGETVKLAVIDWSNETKSKRFEDTQTSEFLLHDTHRDRLITETVNAAVSEWQRGGSFEAGLSGIFSKAGAALGISLGGGYATSSGNRNLKADNVQNLNDNFHQQSSVQRELSSTVVVQSRQEEKESIQTRTFSNYNHSHTLTILYYEVLRHFRIVTELKKSRPALLIKGEDINFTLNETIIKYQKVIEPVIIDSSVIAGFSAIKKYICSNSEFNRKIEQAKLLPDLNGVNGLGAIRVVIKTLEATNGFPSISIWTKGGDEVKCFVVTPLWVSGVFGVFGNLTLPDKIAEMGKNSDEINRNPPNYRQSNSECIFTIMPTRPVVWEAIKNFTISIEESIEERNINTGVYIRDEHQATPHIPWKVESVIITTTSVTDKNWIMVNHKINDFIVSESTISNDIPLRFLVSPYKELPKDALDLLEEDERCSINRLKQHLADNKAYYSTAIWLSENPNARATRFLAKNTGNGETIFDYIANQAIDVIGDFVVFPLAKEIDTIGKTENISDERLITLPTRGVFAEGKLGHCSVSEIIDNTRFWKWLRFTFQLQLT